MKILLLRIAPYEKNSPFNHILKDIYKELVTNKIHVHRVISYNKNQQAEDVIDLKHKEQYLSHKIVRIKKFNKNNFTLRYFHSLWATFKLGLVGLREKNIDAIFITVPQSAFILVVLSLFTKKKTVLLLQDIWPNNARESGIIRDKRRVYRIIHRIQKWIYRKVDSIITISEDMRDLLILDGASPDKIYVAYNWSYHDKKVSIQIEENLFVKQHNINPDKFYVIYAGNIGKVQNVDVLVDAAHILENVDDVKFLIIGDGHNRKKLERKIQDLELKNVIFYPMQESNIATHIYSLANINIIPLKKGIIRTALPSKTAICLSCGKPIIACVDKNSKFAELVQKTNSGIIVAPSDFNDLANNILRIKKDIGLRYKMSESAYNLHDSHFKRVTNVKVYSSVFKSIEKVK